MELVSLQDWDWVLYSTASHCGFQQTVHHYLVWQESKHGAFGGHGEAHPPPFMQQHPYVALFCLTFPLSSLSPPPLLFHYLCSFCIQPPAGLETWGTFNASTLMGWRLYLDTIRNRKISLLHQFGDSVQIIKSLLWWIWFFVLLSVTSPCLFVRVAPRCPVSFIVMLIRWLSLLTWQETCVFCRLLLLRLPQSMTEALQRLLR